MPLGKTIDHFHAASDRLNEKFERLAPSRFVRFYRSVFFQLLLVGLCAFSEPGYILPFPALPVRLLTMYIRTQKDVEHDQFSWRVRSHYRLVTIPLRSC